MSFEEKYITRTIGKMIIATSLITAITSTSLKSAECEIKGTNLIYAYSKAAKHGSGFTCKKRRWNKRVEHFYYSKVRGFVFLPLPTELQCFFSKPVPITGFEKFHALGRGMGDYKMRAFGKSGNWPLNGWKLSRYEMSDSLGNKSYKTPNGGIVYSASRIQNRKWKFSIKKIWLKKDGASCNNIKAVIRSAYGN